MSNINRRTFVKSAGVITGSSLLVGCLGDDGDGDEYPSEEFVLLNPYSPGGGTDTYFSNFVDPLSERFGVSVRQEYEPGAGTANAMRRINNTDSNHIVTWQDVPIQTILQFDLDDPGFDIRDFPGICTVANLAINIIVPEDSQYRDFDQLRTAYQNGDISTIGGIATGSSWHWVTWMMKRDWGLDWDEYISYDGGGPIITAVLSGEVDAGIILGTPIADFVEEGDLHVVLNVGEEQPPSIPVEVDLPSDYNLNATDIRAAGGELLLSIWGPPTLSDEERDLLETEFIEMMQSDSIQSWSEDTGQQVNPEEGSVAEARVDDSFDLEDSYRDFREEIQ